MRIIILLFLTSCTKQLCHNPDLDICAPKEWKNSIDCIDATPINNAWWETFEDPVLNELIETSICHNKDLLVACERIQEARASANLSFSNRFPTLLLTPGIVVAKKGNYTFPMNLSYEFDFWGKFSRADYAARARLLSTEWAYLNVYQTLTAEVANLYFSLRTLDEEILFLQKAIDLRALTVSLFHARAKAGLDPEMDLSRAKLELSTAKQQWEEAKRLRGTAENGLATLLGKLASTFSLPEGQLPPCNPSFPLTFPSDLLLRRPDILEQTAKVKAHLEEVGVATANFFPSIVLSAGSGFAGPELSTWVGWSDRFWSVAFQAVQILLDGGRLKNTRNEKKASYRRTVATYQKQVEIAFQEVENALITISSLNDQYAEQKNATAFAEDTYYLANQQYRAGAINFLQVADAQKNQLEVKRLAIRLKGNQFQATVHLIKALGGNWRETYQ